MPDNTLTAEAIKAHEELLAGALEVYPDLELVVEEGEHPKHPMVVHRAVAVAQRKETENTIKQHNDIADAKTKEIEAEHADNHAEQERLSVEASLSYRKLELLKTIDPEAYRIEAALKEVFEHFDRQSENIKLLGDDAPEEALNKLTEWRDNSVRAIKQQSVES